MKIIILNIVIALSVLGCSADFTKSADSIIPSQPLIDSTLAAEQAMKHLVNGSIFELQGRNADAILEYQDALNLNPEPSLYYLIGKAYLKLNKLGPALKNVKKAVNMEKDNVEYNYLLANIYQLGNVIDSAAALYSYVISIDSLNTGAYFNLGIIYESNRPMQALELYEKLLTITGPQWDVLLKIADLNERMGRVDATIQTVEELYELNPTSLDLQKILIESYLKTANYSKAALLTDDALALYPEDLALIEYKAKIEIMQGNWEAGAEEYLKIINNDEIKFDAKIQIGLAFLAQAESDTVNWSIAENIFKKLDKDSTDWQIKSYLGEIAIFNKQDSTALEYFKEASALARWNSAVWIRLGGLLFDSGKYHETAETIEKVIDNFPEEYALNLILGLAYSQLNKHSEAEPYLLKSVQLNPNDLNALASFGFTLNQINKDDEAIIYLKRALIIDPLNVQILGILGLIYDSKEMFDDSDAIYEKAYQIEPDNPLILNNYAYSLIERNIQIDRAFEMSKSAVEQEPENPSYLDTFGWIYYKKGDFPKAKEYIEKAIEYDGEDAALFDHLGDVYFKIGDEKKAMELWIKSLKLDPDNSELLEKIEKGVL